MSSLTDFYKVLGVSATATEGDIRRAYKKRSLETHPDRFPVGSQAQRDATGQFQEVNNAYYVLSDAGRRRDYDATRTSGDGFGSWWNRARPSETQQERTANSQFESVFEEMMADEAGSNATAQGTGRFYGLLGGGAGAVLGFIVAVSLPVFERSMNNGANGDRMFQEHWLVQSLATGSVPSETQRANRCIRSFRRCHMPKRRAC